eukprot:GHVR01013171.1.p1 GENE.GHVR01013171.1~~GHVR01013171.1.p1  ORF type:complete len:2258 (+),score=491.25 GHVR01013171.1:121-6894(+)
MSNEVIRRCQESINLHHIFACRVAETLHHLRLSTHVGDVWRQTYQRTSRLIELDTPNHLWDFSEASVFAQVDAFVQRCSDLREVCEGLLQFVPTKSRNIELPKFGGARAAEIEKSLAEIEEGFLKNIRRLQGLRYYILDVKETSWHEDYSLFKSQMKDLEVMYTNVVTSAFEAVCSVESGAELIDSFFYLAQRPKIKAFVEKKAEELWTLFLTEVQAARKEFDSFKKRRDNFLCTLYTHPTHSGAALWARGAQSRLKRMKAKMEQLTYLHLGREAEAAAEQYELLMGQLDAFVRSEFEDWQQQLLQLGTGDFGRRLNVALLHRSDTLLARGKGGQLELNFDRGVLRMLLEVYYWEKLQGSGIVVPYGAHEMHLQREGLRILRLHVMRIVRDYNIIIEALTSDQRRLFNEHIRTLDKRIAPGFSKLSWTTPNIKELFVRDVCRECSRVYGYVLNFHERNRKVSELCKAVSEKHLLLIDKKNIHKVEDFKIAQENHRELIMEFFKETVNELTDLLLANAEYFRDPKIDVQREWKLYVEKQIEKKLEEALKKAVKASLQELSRAFNPSDSKRGREAEIAPLFKVEAVLIGVRMDFNPTMTELKDTIQLVCKEMTYTLTVVPRLYDHIMKEKNRRDLARKAELEAKGDISAANAILIHQDDDYEDDEKKKKRQKISFFEEISKDEETLRFIVQVLKGHANCATKLMEKLKFMATTATLGSQTHQPIVTPDKSSYMRRYAAMDRSLSMISKDIEEFREAQTEIQSQDAKYVVCFVEADFMPLKKSLVGHCIEWVQQLTGLLNKNAINETNELLNYFHTNAKILTEPPKSMNDLRMKLDLFSRCQNEITSLEGRMQTVEDIYAKLAEFDVQVSETETARNASLRPQLSVFRDKLVEAEGVLIRSKKVFKSELEVTLHNFSRQAGELLQSLRRRGPVDSEAISNQRALKWIQNFKQEVGKMRATEEGFTPDLELFTLEHGHYKELFDAEHEIEQLQTIWELKEQWDTSWADVKQDKFTTLDVDRLDNTASQYSKSVMKLKGLRQWPLWGKIKGDVDSLKVALPLLSDLRHDSMRDRHWKQIKKDIRDTFDEKSETFTLNQIFELGLPKHTELITRLADDARKEAKIEKGLKEIDKRWRDMQIELTPHKDSFKLSALTTDQIFQCLEENILQLSSFKSSQYWQPFAESVNYWEKSLSGMYDIIQLVSSVQRNWIYLENIFQSPDIRAMLQTETAKFEETNVKFKALVRCISEDRNALRACSKSGMLDQLKWMENSLDTIQKSLEDYLEKKRREFPRFYFISDEDLLEILGQGRNPEEVQKHIKKCFEGINNLELVAPLKHSNKNWEATGMIAPDGEKVKFSSKAVVIDTTGPVEKWLSSVERHMKETLRRQLVSCHQSRGAKGVKLDKWIKDFPGQMIITAGQILWTSETEISLRKLEKGTKAAVKVLKRSQTRYLLKLTDMVKKPLSTIERSKVVALITIEVHARDVQGHLIDAKVDKASDFMWQSQLRFVFEVLDDQAELSVRGCKVLQTETNTPYAYEYQGNNGRLVVTPLTDKCYMTLTMALHLKRGGAPQGPAGTGKTETVKDLGKNLAKFVLVFNCSDSLNFKALGKMFAGLAQCGAWGCFDEFNRIEIEVLSVVATQISTIQNGLKAMDDVNRVDDPRNAGFRIEFEGKWLTLDRGCGIFITMNPGYAGRTELPDNLKSLFRPVAMMVPDLMLIAEIMLMAEGFKEAKSLCKRIVTLYQLMMQQLSKQQHYDFGLRALRSVLMRGGTLKRLEPDTSEHELMMRAIADMNTPKFVAEDTPLFTALLGDLFPGVNLEEPERASLQDALTSCLEADGLQPHPQILLKCIQLYETKLTRHGTMLVGQAMAGKSTAWNVLVKAMGVLKDKGNTDYAHVKTYVINPKSIDMNELYGCYNLATMEWTDGILSSVMRKACVSISDGEPMTQKWILLDGPVDTLWIESMNTTLDDNKLLTLPNGDRISMSSNVSLLFEVEDLSVASPATVSRVGMVYLEVSDLGWTPYVDSWCLRLFPGDDKLQHRTTLRSYFDKYVPKLLQTKRVSCSELVSTSDSNSVVSLTHLFECFAANTSFDMKESQQVVLMEKIFVFSLVWSLGGSVNAASRPAVDQCIRDCENLFPPTQSVYDYCLLVEKNEWETWETKLPALFKPQDTQFHKIIVPTADTLRNGYVLKHLSDRRMHTLLVGEVGTGKTVCVGQSVLDAIDDGTTSTLVVNFSAQTTSGRTQQIIEGRLEKRIQNKYGPP